MFCRRSGLARRCLGPFGTRSADHEVETIDLLAAMMIQHPKPLIRQPATHLQEAPTRAPNSVIVSKQQHLTRGLRLTPSFAVRQLASASR